MKKILLVAEREFMIRVKKPLFIIMTILGPLLLVGFATIPTLLAIFQKDERVMVILDQTGRFEASFKKDKDTKTYDYRKVGDANELKAKVKSGDIDGLVLLKDSLNYARPNLVELAFNKTPSIETERNILSVIENQLGDEKLIASGIDPSKLDEMDVEVNADSKLLNEEGEKDANAAAASVLGYLSGFMIYMFIFLYGMQVFKGVVDEKTNRVVEVIISSVKPIHLMLGKIFGIAAVSVVQFIIWGILSFGLTAVVGTLIPTKSSTEMVAESTTGNIKDPKAKKEIAAAQAKAKDPLAFISDKLGGVPVTKVALYFFLYFIGAYFLYSSLFAAVGSAADNDTDAQQFTLPVTAPLILSMIMLSMVIMNPNSATAVWMSMIPLTSPIIMMVRIPFGIPDWQIWLSLAILFGSFIGTTFIAARIYRVGILMYGKKPNLLEIAKWMFIKD